MSGAEHLRYIGPALGVISGLIGAVSADSLIHVIPWAFVSIWAVMAAVWMHQARTWENLADDWHDLYDRASRRNKAEVSA